MKEYPKINSVFKRFTEGENKGKFNFNVFSQPEFAYLYHNEWIGTEKVDGCLHDKDKIDTNVGSIGIKEIINHPEDFLVKTYNVLTDTIEYGSVIEVSIKEAVESWVEIETESGDSILLTENHKVWLPNLKCYREVRNLEEGDDVLIDR